MSIHVFAENKVGSHATMLPSGPFTNYVNVISRILAPPSFSLINLQFKRHRKHLASPLSPLLINVICEGSLRIIEIKILFRSVHQVHHFALTPNCNLIVVMLVKNIDHRSMLMPKKFRGVNKPRDQIGGSPGRWIPRMITRVDS